MKLSKKGVEMSMNVVIVAVVLLLVLIVLIAIFTGKVSVLREGTDAVDEAKCSEACATGGYGQGQFMADCTAPYTKTLMFVRGPEDAPKCCCQEPKKAAAEAAAEEKKKAADKLKADTEKAVSDCRTKCGGTAAWVDKASDCESPKSTKGVTNPTTKKVCCC